VWKRKGGKRTVRLGERWNGKEQEKTHLCKIVGEEGIQTSVLSEADCEMKRREKRSGSLDGEGRKKGNAPDSPEDRRERCGGMGGVLERRRNRYRRRR
jgi:hypothetical protein